MLSEAKQLLQNGKEGIQYRYKNCHLYKFGLEFPKRCHKLLLVSTY